MNKTYLGFIQDSIVSVALLQCDSGLSSFTRTGTVRRLLGFRIDGRVLGLANQFFKGCKARRSRLRSWLVGISSSAVQVHRVSVSRKRRTPRLRLPLPLPPPGG